MKILREKISCEHARSLPVLKVCQHRFSTCFELHTVGAVGLCAAQKVQEGLCRHSMTNGFGKLPFGGAGGSHKAMVLVCSPIGLSPLHIPTLCGSERVLVVSTELLDDLSCFFVGAGGGG